MERFEGHPVPYQQAKITGGFWKAQQDLFRAVSVNAVYDRFYETGRVKALAMQWKEGDPQKPHIFWESDITKWIEGAAYFLQYERNEALEKKIDDMVADMAATQAEDGYLNTYFTVVEPAARFTRRTDHELYCAGHLVEGAIAYHVATGKPQLLDIATKYIDLIDRVFRIEQSAAFDSPGHQEIELALMRLYWHTGEQRYKTLAEYFIDVRGTSERDETYDFTDQEHMQSHRPVRQQTTAEGHSVRALYMYSGMVDIARANKDNELFALCQTLFENITERRMYITGGVGSTNRGESFTFDYDLPDYTAYSETCAAISLAMYAKRLWLVEADGLYADIAELAIYNTVLAGVSLAGDSFFYENPLAVDPRRNQFNTTRPATLQERLPIMERVKVFDCSCCPPNLLRIVGAISDYQYSTDSAGTIFTQCYMESEAVIPLGNTTIMLRQETQYPHEGDIAITTKTAGAYTLAVRIPFWATNYTLLVNGVAVTKAPKQGFVYLERTWEQDDMVRLSLPMEPQIVEANPLVLDTAGRAAVLRGPVVYCAEGHDNAYPLREVRIRRGEPILAGKTKIGRAMLPTLTTTASIRPAQDALYSATATERVPVPLTLIPYHAWANRGVSEMTVWLLLE